MYQACCAVLLISVVQGLGIKHYCLLILIVFLFMCLIENHLTFFSPIGVSRRNTLVGHRSA